jgi:hypothetical protein
MKSIIPFTLLIFLIDTVILHSICVINLVKIFINSIIIQCQKDPTKKEEEMTPHLIPEEATTAATETEMSIITTIMKTIIITHLFLTHLPRPDS